MSESEPTNSVVNEEPHEPSNSSQSINTPEPQSEPSQLRVNGKPKTIEELESYFKPTTVVLAKVKGYPAWPAMVLDESILPAHIIAKRPKTGRVTTNGTSSSPTASPIKKKKSVGLPTKLFPVRFFSDDTYIWINSNDIKLLTKDDISAHFTNSNSKRRKDNLLERAYELANDPPDMELFVQYGSRAAPPSEDEIVEEENVEAGEEQEEPVKAPPKKKAKVVKAKTKAKTKATTAAAAAKAAKAKKDAAEAAKKKAAAEKKLALDKKKQEEKKLMSEYDDDWGLDEINAFDLKSGNYIFEDEDEQKQTFGKIIPSGPKLQQHFIRNQNKFDKLSDKLSELLINQEEDVNRKGEEILTLLDEFQGLISSSNFPKTLILKSKLFRVLILILRKPLEQFGNEQIKEKISKILIKQLDVEVKNNSEFEENGVDSEANSTLNSKAASQEPETIKVENGK
ncbi:transcription coactivator [Scheffersomyces amazonensis]|uniref:transcription coactivator n=1 Tax=Scheffersomyces amazonensis TaxID=1078765 RepID=UPI00315C98D5